MATITKDDDLTSFDVPETARHQSGHTIYKIVLQVTPRELTQNSYQIVYWKRYTDIRKLYEVLHRYHQAVFRPGKFPDFPSKAGFMERFNPVVVEERRAATKQFLNFALQQLYLRTHDAYIDFFQKGEKVLLPDVETSALQPESLLPVPVQASTDAVEAAAAVSPPPSQPIVNEAQKSPKEEKLLITADEEEQIEQVSNRCAQILDDLNDLQFDQQEEIKQETEEFRAIKAQVDEVSNLLSLPLATTTDQRQPF